MSLWRLKPCTFGARLPFHKILNAGTPLHCDEDPAEKTVTKQ